MYESNYYLCNKYNYMPRPKLNKGLKRKIIHLTPAVIRTMAVRAGKDSNAKEYIQKIVNDVAKLGV